MKQEYIKERNGGSNFADTNEEPAETVEADYKTCDPGNGTYVYMCV